MAMPTTAKPMLSASNAGSVACRHHGRNTPAGPGAARRLGAAAELVRAVGADQEPGVAHQPLERLEIVRVVDAADLELAVDQREVAIVRDRWGAGGGDA